MNKFIKFDKIFDIFDFLFQVLTVMIFFILKFFVQLFHVIALIVVSAAKILVNRN